MMYEETAGELEKALFVRLLPAAAVVLAVLCLIVVGMVRRKRLSMDDNLLMTMLFDKVQKRQIRVLFINSYVACINFQPVKSVTTSAKTSNDGGRYITSTVEYTGTLRSRNVMDFNDMGYKPIPRWELREYKKQMLERIRALPFVQSVEVCRMDSFTPKELFVSGGRHTTNAHRGTCWVINYQNPSQKVVPQTNGIHIG